jgi:hypothetical protein
LPVTAELWRLKQEDHEFKASLSPCLSSLPSKTKTKTTPPSQALVAHACNLSYSGGRDQEHLGSNPAWANSLQDLISKKKKKKEKEIITK